MSTTLEKRLEFDDVVQELLLEVAKVCAGRHQITDDLMLALNTIFGETLLHTFALLDTHKVTLLKSPNGKTMFEVMGRSGRLYSLFPLENFCTCKTFENQVLCQRNSITCKHVLAIWLSKCMNSYEERTVSNSLMTAVIMNAIKMDEIVNDNLIANDENV